MGRIFYDVESYKEALDTALEAVLDDRYSQTLVKAREGISKAVEEIVYSYTPKFYSRRGHYGGLADQDNMDSYSTGKGFTVHFAMTAEWQQLYGGEIPDNSLAEVVNNDGMYGAPPRNFIGNAETEKLNGSATLEIALQNDMEARGL